MTIDTWINTTHCQNHLEVLKDIPLLVRHPKFCQFLVKWCSEEMVNSLFGYDERAHK